MQMAESDPLRLYLVWEYDVAKGFDSSPSKYEIFQTEGLIYYQTSASPAQKQR